jgi:hypothetical protein
VSAPITERVARLCSTLEQATGGRCLAGEECSSCRAIAEAMAEERRELVMALCDIEALASGWDEDGALGPRAPLSWESVARMAMDFARAAFAKAEGR